MTGSWQFLLSEKDFQPAYQKLAEGELARRAEQALATFEHYKIYPRNCGANRIRGNIGTCITGAEAIVGSAFPHFGEETCLSGCNLRWRNNDLTE